MSVMRAIRRYKWPQNEHTADLIRFVPHFRELQLSWTAGAAMSDGMEKFVEEFLPRIRQSQQSPNQLSSPQVSWYGEIIFELVSMFPHFVNLVDCDPFVVGMLPRGQELLDIETRGHDVFSVYSKYKGDPVDPNAMTSMKHPHLKYQPMIKKKHRPPTF